MVIQYSRIQCKFCEIIFQPTTSRNKHCSAECRFKDVAKNFSKIDGCWNWPLSLNKQNGYGQFSVSSNPMQIETAHRMSYKVFVGDIDKGQYICHQCDNRSCFNPKHLFMGTALDNNHDMLLKGRDRITVITLEIANQIKEKLKTTKQHQICKQFGVSKSIVSGIFRKNLALEMTISAAVLAVK